MSPVSAKEVQALRQVTGAGMMDAKRALQETNGDAAAATKWLRERGLSQSAARSDRANEQGAVAVARAGGAAATIELKSETDYVAKSDAFKALADKLAEAVAARGEDATAEFDAEIDDLRVTLKENIGLGRVVRFDAPEGAVIDSYLHVQNGRGVNGVLVELTGGDADLAHDIALHIASQRPRWVSRDDVPPETIAAERETLEQLTRNEGKPEQAIPKIVEGRLGGFFKDVGGCLLDQAFVKDNKQTVGQVLGDASVTRFTQVEIGR
ncbi:MAG TPA: translation elongation factor Ts [Acidimicrobiales bacterium]|nr:translation elongation factor Ts [Acidimicrobiales bacterium]